MSSENFILEILSYSEKYVFESISFRKFQKIRAGKKIYEYII